MQGCVNSRCLFLCGVLTLLVILACQPTPSSPATSETPISPLPGATLTSTPTSDLDARFHSQRQRMVAEDIEARGVTDALVLEAMRTVPRHLFVLERYQGRAYDDTPLPISEGQTISQPYIVALMSQLLKVKPGEKILEVGTGSGYQAAVLAQMGTRVFSIEIIPTLAQDAQQHLTALGYRDIKLRVGDGYFGWTEEAPFDGIIVTAAPDHVPSPLLAQLKPTGRIVIPVGPPGGVQTLWLVEQQEGQWVSLNQGLVRFVPLLRE